MPRGANLPAIAAFNDTVVLDAIRRSGDGMSRVELVGATGLSAQTVSNVSRRLLGQGLIREAGKQIDGPGKPRTILQLEPRGSYAVGVHLDPTVITCVLLDLEGSVIEHVRRHSPVSGDPAETIAVAVDAIGDVLKRSGVDRSRVSGVGVAAPGPIDVGTGVVVRPPLVPGWNDLHLGDELTAATGLPSLLAKDVTAAAVGERWRDPAGASGNFAFVYYGTGVGVGMVLAGAVYTGASQNAGDVGHAVVDPGPDGALCACGRRGCYGESVRPYRLVMQGIRAGVLRAPGGAPVPDGVDLDLDVDTVDELFTALTRAADDGDAAAAAILDRSIRNSALYLSNLAALLDIDRVVYGGPSWARVERRYLEQLPERLREIDMSILTHPVTLASSSVGDDVAAVGAACLVLDATFSPR
ncbi:ROK family transcriptional regulator [Leifsonia poae]|uniref:Sugar kinase n=1 Tax=Leifsonia poae TaxID=110933 RepID=A0A9W6H9N6_9MICO|nr:ROK family transcriptional regulator [Leifsonia poae]GLJ75912.1 sugar kinase [Leifsonia poae]